MSLNFKKYWEITKETFKKFFDDDPMSYSAIIAFSTIFSLPAVLIIVIRVAGIFLGDKAITGELFHQVKGLIGADGAAQLQEIVKNSAQSDSGAIATIVGIATLIVSATTVFISIQMALNSIWKVKAKPEKGWLKLIVNRVLSFALVISFGFIMLVSLLMEALISMFNDLMKEWLSKVGAILAYVVNYAFSLAIITLVFAIIFRYLPDAKIKWKDTWHGALLTAILFAIGKFGIGFYLGNSDLGSTYGAAGSVVIILMWVYYASLIMLLGAKFTQVITEYSGGSIKPSDHAVKIEVHEIEKDL